MITSKRVRLTWFEKVSIIEKAKSMRWCSYNELARWAAVEFSLPTPPHKSTILRILKASHTLLAQPIDTAQRKNSIADARLQLDTAVVEFVLFAEVHDVSITGAMIIEQARRLAVKLKLPRSAWPRFGPSWLRCLQERYGFSWRRAYGDSSSVDMKAVEEDLQRLRNIISAYSPRDVFNMDETAFFYNAVPRGSICKNAAPSLKQSKDRLTMVVCANASGTEKLPLLYLGKSTTPRWYSRKPTSLQYFGTPKGWMTSWMFQQWLVGLDETMHSQGRHILLLVGNASSHDKTGLSLTNVRLEMLPPNTTARVQPMDQGIIHCIKRQVLNQKMHFALEHLGDNVDEPYKVDMLTALLWCETAWQNISAVTIENCWKHSGLINRAEPARNTDKANLSFMLN